MFKVSELNPKDVVLDDIHKIQKVIYEKDKNISQEERIKRYNSVKEDLMKNYKVKLNIFSLNQTSKV